MAYTKTTWNTGDPITQERMNKIEQGIFDAHSTGSTNSSNIANMETTLNTATSDIGQAKSNIEALQRDVSSFVSQSREGQAAWAQVSDAVQIASGTPAEGNLVYGKTLSGRFEDVEGGVRDLRIEVQDAHRSTTDTLDKRLDDIDSVTSQQNTAIGVINDKFASAKFSSRYGDYPTVEARLEAGEDRVVALQNELSQAHQSNAYDRVNDPYASIDARFEDSEGRINNIRSEIDAAHESTALNKTGNSAYNTLDERFEAIESELVGQTAMSTRLDTIEDNVGGLSDNKVNKTDIANNLTTETAGKVLDATQGKILNDAKINYTDIRDNLTSTDVDKPLSAKQGKVLKDTIDAMDTAYKAADTALDGRLDTIEDDLNTASTGLKARMTAVEGRATTLETDVHTIASELAMIDNNSIVSTNTRVDTLENDLRTMANELNMLDGTAIVDTNTRIDTIEGTINDPNTGLAATKAIADAAATAEALGTTNDNITALAGRVTTLEGKDTVLVPYDGEHSNFTEDVPNLQNPVTTADYLIADDEGKYFYWRYLGAEDGWQMISGGGGNGSSSGEILAELPEVAAGDPNVDYFIGNDSDGYTHYRFVEAAAGESAGHFIRILPNNLINDLSVDQYGGLVAHTIGDNQTNVLADFYALKSVTYTPNYDPNDATQLVSQTLQFTGTDGQALDPIVIVGGGGGGGSVYTVRIETTSDIARSIPANSTDPVTIRAKVVMKQGADLVPGATATGQIQYRVYGTSTWYNGEQIEVEAIEESLKYTIQNDTYFTVDVSKYLETDKTMQIRLVINAHPESETETVVRYQTYSISKVNISIAAESFDYASVKNGNFQFNYRCFGSGITKTVHFVLDETDIVTPVTTTTHNIVLQQVIPMTGKSNGMHTFQVYFVTSTGLESNRLNYYILYNTDSTRQAPLLGAAAQNTSIVDGDELVVNYSVNTIGFEKTDEVEIELYTMDGDTKVVRQTDVFKDIVNNVEASPPYRTFNYPHLTKANPSDPDPEPITVYVKLTASHTVIVDSVPTVLTDTQTVQVTISYLNTKYSLEEEGKSNILYSYTAYGRSNNNEDKATHVYKYTNVNNQEIDFTGTFTNFNWSTDGYKDGESLLIGGGATYNIDVPIFSYEVDGKTIEENANIDEITQNGRTIEIDYEVLAATDMNATIINCMNNNNIGFRVTPQNCYLLNSGSRIDIDETGFIKNEENVAAAYLTPGTRTHLTFVIEPWAANLAADGNYHQSTNIYINGEFANACPYKRNSSTGTLDGNSFSTTATISIGSDTCLIKLYSIKLYNRGLTQSQVLHNYEVAPVATRNKLNRLEDNDVLNSQGLVDYEKARKKYTCLLLTGPGEVNGNVVPTMAPYKGYPSPMGRVKDGETVGKTESGLLLTKPSTETTEGYVVEFNLQDKLKDPNGYGYASSNNVQGTSSQKFPVKNLKVYLAKGKAGTEVKDETVNTYAANTSSITTAATAAYMSAYPSAESVPEYITNCASAIATIIEAATEPTQEDIAAAVVSYLTTEDATVGAAYVSPGNELVIDHPIIPGVYTKSDKVKYALRGADGYGDSTLCWKADYMSTDHANTFNANIANFLYTTEDRLSDRWTDKTQYAVYGIKCLLFQKSGDNPPEFVGDGCLNNDKGNHSTFGLETKEIENVWPGDDGNDTMCQKWDFRNNTNSILYFKHDGLFKLVDDKPDVSSCIECIYPDEGDLADEQAKYMSEHNNEKNPKLDPNYNHFQILSSWVGNRANYWYESDATLAEPLTYNGQSYDNLKAYKKAIFRNEFTRHFNLNHILIYYLFLEYTALVDNRVKNIHMRTDNAGTELVKKTNGDTLFEGNSNPNMSWWYDVEDRVRQEPIMDENGNYQYDENTGAMVLGNVTHSFFRHADEIDWEVGEGHSNFAIWAPVLYDLDSCFGAENVGFLRIRYDADWDYTLYGKLQQAGYDSILWFQVADCFDDEIRAMAKTLYNRTVGLNYSTFYRYHITDNLVSLSPAVTNQDMILKFEKPWTEGFLDYSKDPVETSTDEYKYLQRGTRTTQKMTFMKQRSMLLSSKYDANEFKKDVITFRAGTVVNEANTVITLTANQKLYHGVQFGDLNDVSKVTRRAYEMYDSEHDTWVPITTGWIPEFTPCRLKNNTTMQNSDGIEVYGASVLNDIGDLSKFHPYQLKVGNAVNLKKLIIGSSNAGYSNTATIGIGGLDSCLLLEEINVCNLKNLTSLSLSNNGFIKKVYATGSGLHTLSLPAGGVLDTIAYGENTTDITIINQGRMTNFSYENSGTNHYGNVTRLWIENTPNIPVKDIITARATERSSQDQGLRAGGLRIVGIDLDLGSDPTFLELLASDLMNGMYLTSSGGHTDGNDLPPYISGKIHITSIRASLLDKLNTRYPNLIIYNTIDNNGIPSNNVITEYSIEYRNYDDTLLFTDYRTGSEHYIDPAYDINPITNTSYLWEICPPDGIPKKPQDAQYIYRFGTYSNGTDYDRFSGWINSDTGTVPTEDDYVRGNTVFIAYYPTTVTRRYRVNWYEEPDSQSILSYEAEYGTDMSNYTQPEEKASGEEGAIHKTKIVNNIKKVFKGWDRPVGRLTGDLNVYALWETSTIDNATSSITMSTLNAADIYALSQIGAQTRRDLLESKLGVEPIYIRMGQDFYYTTGVNTYDLLNGANKFTFNNNTSNIQIYDGAHGTLPEIRPLQVNSDWTFAIDYKFLLTSTLYSRYRELVLASCYKEADGAIQGFKLSLVKSTEANSTRHEIRLSWGTASTVLDYVTIDTTAGLDAKYYSKSYRNMLVIRHRASEPTVLYAYFVAPNLANANATVAGSNYGLSVTGTTLTWSNISNLEAPLIFGGNFNANTSTIENNTSGGRGPAKGIIYWSKFWDTDLGSKNCYSLAAWPHETIPFYLCGYNNNDVPSREITENTKLEFVAAQGVGDRYVFARTGAMTDDMNVVEVSWRVSSLRTFCNDRLYKGLPMSYRSIIKQASVGSAGFSNSGVSASAAKLISNDYFYLPTEREVSTITANGTLKYDEVASDWPSPWPWMKASNITNMYGPASGIDNVLELKTATTIAPFLYRFSGYSIKPTAKIFNTGTTDPYNNGTAWLFNNTDLRVQSGDIWINGNLAYMYFTNEDLEEGVNLKKQIDVTDYDDIVNAGGAWKKADIWALRTYDDTVNYSVDNKFERIDDSGTLLINQQVKYRITHGRIICPEFSV